MDMAQVQQQTYLGVSPIQSPSELPNNSYDNDILVENTRRNSLQAQDLLPDAIKQTIMTKPDEPSSSCRRCSGDGIVAKPCRFCNATGKVRKRSSCVDCQAEKNGCGNTNCKSCFGSVDMVSRGCEHSIADRCTGSDG